MGKPFHNNQDRHRYGRHYFSLGIKHYYILRIYEQTASVWLDWTSQSYSRALRYTTPLHILKP